MDIMKKSVLLTLVSTVATQAVAGPWHRMPKPNNAAVRSAANLAKQQAARLSGKNAKATVRLSKLAQKSGVPRGTITNMVKTTSSHGSVSVSADQAARVFKLANNQSNVQSHLARMEAIRNRRNLTTGKNALYAAQEARNLSQEEVMSILQSA